MSRPAGRSLRLSAPRRFMGDLVHFASRVPLTTMQRCLRLAPVVAAREAARPKPGWCAVFAKAFAFVSAARPELRRAYLPFPWPRLYEHPGSVAAVAVERRLPEEDAVFFTHLRNAEQQSLGDIDAHLRRCKELPVERFGLFRKTLKVSRLPRPLRRLLWWVSLNTSGGVRARRLGTFGLSVVANFGAETLTLLSPLTSAFNYGVFREDGSVEVRLTYDHRVLDGGTAARALEDLERVLKCEIVAELRYLHSVEAA